MSEYGRFVDLRVLARLAHASQSLGDNVNYWEVTL